MSDQTNTIDQMRAQYAALERDLAAASIAPTETYIALLGSPEVDQLLNAIAGAAEQLDGSTRARIAQWTKMRNDLVTLANMDLARMRKLVEVTDAAPADEATS